MLLLYKIVNLNFLNIYNPHLGKRMPPPEVSPGLSERLSGFEVSWLNYATCLMENGCCFHWSQKQHALSLKNVPYESLS